MLSATLKESLVEGGVLVILVIIAAGLRVWHLDRECPYCDEVASLQHLDAPDLATFLDRERQSDPPMAPAYFVIEYEWAKLTRGSVYGIRLLSVLFGLATIPLVHLLAKRMYNATGGFVAALCCALSITQIYYSEEIRPYAMVVFFATLSGFSFWLALREGKKRWWVLNVVSNIILMWSHFFCVFFLFAQGCYLLAHSVRARKAWTILLWTLGHVPSLALLLWWAASIDQPALDTASLWRMKLVHSYLMPLGDFLLYAGGGVPTFRDVPAFPGHDMGGVMWRAFAAILLWNVVLTLHTWLKGQKAGGSRDTPKPLNSFVYLMTWAIVPPLALFVFSWQVHPCHTPRYIMYGSVGFMVLIGGAVALTPGRWARVGMVLALVSLYSYNLYAHPGPWRHEIKRAGEYLSARAAKDEHILCYNGSDVAALIYNDPELLRHPLDSRQSFEEIDIYLAQLQLAANNLWFVLHLHENPASEIEYIERRIRDHGFAFERAVFGFVRPVYVYRISITKPR